MKRLGPGVSIVDCTTTFDLAVNTEPDAGGSRAAPSEPPWPRHPGFRVQGPGFRVQGSGSGVQGSGFRVQGVWFRGYGSGFRVQDIYVYPYILKRNQERDLGFRV